jgi:hypothetical protein
VEIQASGYSSILDEFGGLVGPKLKLPGPRSVVCAGNLPAAVRRAGHGKTLLNSRGPA